MTTSILTCDFRTGVHFLSALNVTQEVTFQKQGGWNTSTACFTVWVTCSTLRCNWFVKWNVCLHGCCMPVTFCLRVEDYHRGGGGRLERFAQRENLFGSGEHPRECRQLFERDVGGQSGVQSQHGRHNAVGQETFWFHTENNTKSRKRQICRVTSCWYSDSRQTVQYCHTLDTHKQGRLSFIDSEPLAAFRLTSLWELLWSHLHFYPSAPCVKQKAFFKRRKWVRYESRNKPAGRCQTLTKLTFSCSQEKRKEPFWGWWFSLWSSRS